MISYFCVSVSDFIGHRGTDFTEVNTDFHPFTGHVLQTNMDWVYK